MYPICLRGACVVLASALIAGGFNPQESYGLTNICIRQSDGRVTVRDSRCGRGEKKLSNINSIISVGTKGETGPAGPAGKDGSLRIYGDGSGGAKVVGASTTLVDTNLQYTDFTIAAGVTLTIESGAVIRCTGTFTNNGTIVVGTSAFGGTFGTTAGFNGAGLLAFATAHPGLSVRQPESGEVNPVNTVPTAGGRRGRGVSVFQAHQLLLPGLLGGGGGAGNALLLTAGGRGGGSLVVLSEKGIVNSFGAVISANGSNATFSAGGGSGGVIILASPGSVANNGALNSNGGSGGQSTTVSAAGGGGSGGIVHILTPNVLATGAISVTGGAAGAISGNVTGLPRSGGSGGGSLGGGEAGGTGGGIPAGAAVPPLAAEAGDVGQAIVTLVDPTSLF